MCSSFVFLLNCGRNWYVTAVQRHVNNSNIHHSYGYAGVWYILLRKKYSMWLGLWSKVSQKWEGLCGTERYRDMGHTSLSGKDKVFPNEDLLGVIPIPETIDVHFIPARKRPQAIKHCCLIWNALQIKYSNHLNCQLRWFWQYERFFGFGNSMIFIFSLMLVSFVIMVQKYKCCVLNEYSWCVIILFIYHYSYACFCAPNFVMKAEPQQHSN